MHHRCFRTNFCFSLKGQVSFIALLLFALVQCSLAGSSHTPSGEGGSCGRPDLETEKKIIAALMGLSVTVGTSINCGGTGADGCFTSQKRMPDFCGEYEVCVTVKGRVETMNAGYDSGDYTIPAATPDTPSYDADGNMLSCGGWAYTWNGEDRLASATRGTTRLEFNYDYMGRRFEKKVYQDSVLVRHSLFVYDGFKQIAEYNALANDALASTYVWQPVGLDVPLLRNGQEFYVADANKNVVALLDTEGQVTDTYVYDPFGNCTHTGTSSNPFRFSSEHFDAETGLTYYNFRYYNSIVGKWLSRDPLNDYQLNSNTYLIVENSPVIFNDTLGLLLIEKALLLFDLKYNPPPNKDITPFQLGVEWLTGLGPRHREFTDGDTFAELLRSHKHIQNLISVASNILTQKCNADCTYSKKEIIINNKKGAYNLDGIKGVIEYIEDYSSLISFGMTGNLAVTYLGSYSASVESVSINCCQNSAQILITVNNSSTATSAFRPPVLGYTEWWANNIAPKVNAFFSSGMGSPTTQKIILNEKVKLSSICGN